MSNECYHQINHICCNSHNAQPTSKLTLFEPPIMCKNPSILIIGSRESGKTAIIRKIVNSLRIPQNTLYRTVITNTIDTKYYSNKFTKHTRFNPSIIEHLYNRQNQKCRYEHLLILDECMYDQEWKSQEIVNKFYSNNNALNTTIIHTMTYPDVAEFMIPTLDYAFIVKPNLNMLYRQALYDKLQPFLSFDEFNKELDNMQSYHCMVINYKKGSMHKMSLNQFSHTYAHNSMTM